jgi:hypothetical protein
MVDSNGRIGRVIEYEEDWPGDNETLGLSQKSPKIPRDSHAPIGTRAGVSQFPRSYHSNQIYLNIVEYTEYEYIYFFQLLEWPS